MNDTQVVKNIENIPVRPLDRATPNPTPVSPNKSQITRTCVGLGVLIFLGVAVGLSFIDDRVKSAWDVESFIGSNLLGIIPDLTAMKDEEKYTLLMDNKQAPGVEAFLSVYSSIKIHSKLDFPKSILVTSTIPGEGKTLISCNVAGAFARHSRKTLLIDCDLRRPMLHRHFKQQNNSGLITWFEGGAAMEGDLATNPALGIIKVSENLSLLCSGGRSKSPTELLENPAFGQLLERLKREYDLVIVDSPPLGAVTDSLLIAERIDEVVYVCRFNRAYRKHIRLYMRALRNGKNEVLGIVLNGLSPRRIEYYSNYRYYRSYKKYYGAQT
ncbi:MAG: polysaccharide biosynthesis tyrosine autokinase [Opitutus sp.]|nr:polysaccharide biosynthesis tyrosine autokinase [Opitutus sp.]